MTRHKQAVVFGVLVCGLLAAGPALQATTLPVTSTTTGALTTAPSSLYASFSSIVWGTVTDGIQIDAAVYLDSSTSVYTYVYELTMLGSFAGLNAFTIDYIFDASLSAGDVTDLANNLVGAVPSISTIDIDSFNTTWEMTGVDAGETIAVYAQSFSGPYHLGSGRAINTGFHSGTVPVPAPEPGTMILLGSGLLGSGYLLRRRKTKVQKS